MSYSIIFSTKILTLAIAPFLFILVGVLCEFAMMQGVYILLDPQEEGVHYFCEGTDVHIQQHIHRKYLNLCLTSYQFAKVIMNWKKSKQGNQLCYNVYDESK